MISPTTITDVQSAADLSADKILLSLTPGFSPVKDVSECKKPFQRFLAARVKPLKRFPDFADTNTGLKPGANASCVPIPNKQRAFLPLLGGEGWGEGGLIHKLQFVYRQS